MDNEQACGLAAARLRALAGAMDHISYSDRYTVIDIERIYELSFHVGQDPYLAWLLVADRGDRDG